MKLSLKQIIAGAVLAAAAATPASAFQTTIGGTGDGSLVVTVFDQVAGLSVMQDLGLTASQFLDAAVTGDAGFTLSRSIDLSIFGGNTANLEYTVYAGDNVGMETEWYVLATANPANSISTTNSDISNINGSSAYGQINLQCGGVSATVCEGVLSPASGRYLGGSDWGDNLQFANFQASGAINTALGFYTLNTTFNADEEGVVAGDAATITQYANSAGTAALWLLAADGTLTFTSAAVGGAPVPVPAALWLLLSGLGGLGVIGRRRSNVAA